MKLKDRVAIVTGASRGIGREIALALAREGATVVINYLSNSAKAEEVITEIRNAGGTAEAVAADVTKLAEAEKLVAAVIERFGKIDILVNNAGISRDKLIAQMSPEDWIDVMHTNFGGVFNCTKAVMQPMMLERAGRIINISSVQAEQAWAGAANYSASKAAINAFTRSAALELARFGIRVNAVAPGWINTDLIEPLVRKGAERITKMIPLRNIGLPADVAAAVVFLASDDSSYLTGAVLPVDGGTATTLGIGFPV